MMIEQQPKAKAFSLFFCVSCGNVIVETPDTCHHVERTTFIRDRKKYYRSGWCTECWRLYHPITVDDKLALHLALENLTSLRIEEPLPAIVERFPKRGEIEAA